MKKSFWMGLASVAAILVGCSAAPPSEGGPESESAAVTTPDTQTADGCVLIPESTYKCGIQSNGCGGTYTLPNCPAGERCSEGLACMKVFTCPKGTHSCGDGTCGIVCN